MELTQITAQAAALLQALLDQTTRTEDELLVIGCSTSEVLGAEIGTHSSLEVAGALIDGFWPLLQQHQIALAAQCCEHLNRALIVERQTAKRFRLTEVNVLPQPKAGGSFATAVWDRLSQPVAVEGLCEQATLGIDIGGTMIGMHIMPVVVPMHLSPRQIGEATVVCARRRPKFVGGSRAVYQEALL